MKTIAIGDIHGRTIWKDIVAKENADRVVFIGDYFDSYDDYTAAEQMHNFKEIIEFKESGEVIMMIGNHDCFVEETEFLTKEGWKTHKDIRDDEELAQFDSDYNISWAKPNGKILKYAQEVVSIKGDKTFQKVTLNHDVIIDGIKVKAHSLLGRKDIQSNQIPNCGKLNTDEDNGINPLLYEYLAWVISDSTLVYKNDVLARIQFKLSKPHKIEKLKNLLEKLGISYTFRPATKSGINVLDPYYIRIYTSVARDSIKDLPITKNKLLTEDFTKINTNQWECFLRGLNDSDGFFIGNATRLVSISKTNLDIIQRYCLFNNISAHIRNVSKKSGFDNGKQQYHLTIFYNKNPTRVRQNYIIIDQEMYNGNVVCYSMPLGTLVTRLEGRIAFSGNCHYIDGSEHYSGYQAGAATAINDLLHNNLHHLQMCYQMDEFLFSHAGVSHDWLELHSKEYKENNDADVAQIVNNLWEFTPRAFKFAGWDPYGDSVISSPIWIRPLSLVRSNDGTSLKEKYTQVVGHTQVKRMDREGNATGGRYHLIDTLGTSREYLIIEDGEVKFGTI